MPQATSREIINELLGSLNQAKVAESKVPERPIHISELTGLPAFAYEKLRNIIDYKEENLLRKNAISRFFKRKFLIPQFNLQPTATARELVRELILSRYVANDSVDESQLGQIGVILNKY